MARCLLGVLVVTAGLVVLASAARENRLAFEEKAPPEGNRLRETGFVTATGSARTLLRIAPAFGLQFSLN